MICLSPSATSQIIDQITDSYDVDVLFWADKLKKVQFFKCIMYSMHNNVDFLSSAPNLYGNHLIQLSLHLGMNQLQIYHQMSLVPVVQSQCIQLVIYQ